MSFVSARLIRCEPARASPAERDRLDQELVVLGPLCARVDVAQVGFLLVRRGGELGADVGAQEWAVVLVASPGPAASPRSPRPDAARANPKTRRGATGPKASSSVLMSKSPLGHCRISARAFSTPSRQVARGLTTPAAKAERFVECLR